MSKCYSCGEEASVMKVTDGRTGGLGFVPIEFKFYCRKCYEEYKKYEAEQNGKKR